MKYLIITFLVLLVAFEYACMVASKRADKQAEELWKRYKEHKDNETNNSV